MEVFTSILARKEEKYVTILQSTDLLYFYISYITLDVCCGYKDKKQGK